MAANGLTSVTDRGKKRRKDTLFGQVRTVQQSSQGDGTNFRPRSTMEVIAIARRKDNTIAHAFARPLESLFIRPCICSTVKKKELASLARVQRVCRRRNREKSRHPLFVHLPDKEEVDLSTRVYALYCMWHLYRADYIRTNVFGATEPPARQPTGGAAFGHGCSRKAVFVHIKTDISVRGVEKKGGGSDFQGGLDLGSSSSALYVRIQKNYAL